MAYESPYQADVESKYEQAQLRAAQSQAHPSNPWRDAKGNITNFGAIAGQAAPQVSDASNATQGPQPSPTIKEVGEMFDFADDQKEKMARITEAAREFACTVIQNVAPIRDREAALRMIGYAVNTAKSSIVGMGGN
jgi:hypothetical protein